MFFFHLDKDQYSWISCEKCEIGYVTIVGLKGWGKINHIIELFVSKDLFTNFLI